MSVKMLFGVTAIGAAALLGAAAWAFAGAPESQREASEPREAVMVVIPGGAVRLGDDAAPPAEGPSFVKEFKAFLLDRTPVTVAQFSAFVRDTGYVTDAERLGEAGVLDRASGGWVLVKGADWRRPFGPRGAHAASDHPVTQVSWRDAAAFCRAYGARLPTEFEWERAARLGQTPEGHVFRAGDPVSFQGRHLANVWQGLFPMEDLGEDGFRATSPVGAFGETPAGLTDMAGNVWEWTASRYLPYPAHDDTVAAGGPAHRVQRGGSFLCDPSFCEGFRATARNHATPDTALMHVGFRCAADAGATMRAGRVKDPAPEGRT